MVAHECDITETNEFVDDDTPGGNTIESAFAIVCESRPNVSHYPILLRNHLLFIVILKGALQTLAAFFSRPSLRRTL